MRILELRDLTWQHVDFDRRNIRIRGRANRLNEDGFAEVERWQPRHADGADGRAGAARKADCPEGERARVGHHVHCRSFVTISSGKCLMHWSNAGAASGV